MYVDFTYRVNESIVSHRTLLWKTCIFDKTKTQEMFKEAHSSIPVMFLCKGPCVNTSSTYFLLSKKIGAVGLRPQKI